jgi:hypothetical protein
MGPDMMKRTPILIGLAGFSAARAGMHTRAIERKHAIIPSFHPVFIISILLSEVVIERSPVQYPGVEFHEGFLLTPRLFPLKAKKYLRRHPADCQLEYIYFMKMGQPKLSERVKEVG